ncbi:MAG TPA: TldD/PmbA family protein [Terriglobales bacterium]|jgi:predicted Zn-dependent protease|nr:TldD/PmbA family protein [Terriglobales bacterium]
MLTKETIATALTREQGHEVFSRLQKFSTADEIEVLISGGTSSLTRFANNTIHQNVSEENCVVSVRSVFGQRTARATTNKLDDASLRRVVEAAEALAKVQAPDPDLLPVADPELAQPAGDVPERSFDATAALTPEDRAAAVKKMVAVATRNQLTAAGIFSSSLTAEALLNSRGLAVFHTQTSSEISITMLGEDSSGWQKANSPDVRDLDPVGLAETAARKARESAHPRELAPGKYSVVLEPAAVLDLVGFMFLDFGGLAVLDQRSFLTGRLGAKLFGDNITVHDDVYHPLQSGAPFDGEGVRRQRVTLVENGTVRNLVYARATAEKMKKSEHAAKVGHIAPTGHGFPLPNEIGEAPINIVFEGAPESSRRSLEQMIASTDRGVLVTRLWYIREVDPYEKILTGMTRDGTFYIEGGSVQHGVRNFRFNESLIHLLSNVVEMGTPVRASGEESFDMVVPAMKVTDFNFTEVTKF